jgi:quinol monooxygenase YgiN
MKIIGGTLNVQAVAIDKVKEAAITMQQTTRTEAGCLTYVFTQDLEDPTVFRFFEIWDDDADLAAHNSSAHMKAFGRVLATSLTGTPSGHSYEASDGVSLF